MPWIRTIASGPNALGDLARQSWNVAQTNLRTQKDDIAAEQGWNADIANLQRADEATQYGRKANADAIARQQYQWGVGRQDAQARDALAATLDREKTAATLRLNQQEEAQGLAERNNVINNFKQAVAERGSALDNAEAAFQDASSRLNPQSIESKYTGLIEFDPTKKAFRAKEITNPASSGAATEANAIIANAAAGLAQAKSRRDQLTAEFVALQKTLGGFNLTVDRRGGQWVIIDPLEAPGKSEHRWTAPVGDNYRPGSMNPLPETTQPPGRWSAPMDVPASPQMPSVETSSEQTIRQAFPTPDAVRAAALSGQLSREQAIEILTTAF